MRYFESESGVAHRLRTDKASSCINTASDSLRELVEGFILQLKIENYSPRTISYYSDYVNNFVHYLGDTDISTVTPQHIRLFRSQIGQPKPRSPGNRKDGMALVGRHWVAMRSFFRWLCSEGILDSSPMARIKAPKRTQRIIRSLSQEELIRLLENCNSVRDKAILLILLDCGLRVSEMADLKLSDIDLHNQPIIVQAGKGNKQRQVRFGNGAAKALWRYLRVRGDNHSPYLWIGYRGDPLSPYGIQQMVRKLGKRCGISVHPHLLRHTFAISYLRNGGDVFSLQYGLGHSRLDIVKVYLGSLGYEDLARVHKVASPVDNLGVKLIGKY